MLIEFIINFRNFKNRIHIFINTIWIKIRFVFSNGIIICFTLKLKSSINTYQQIPRLETGQWKPISISLRRSINFASPITINSVYIKRTIYSQLVYQRWRDCISRYNFKADVIIARIEALSVCGCCTDRNDMPGVTSMDTLPFKSIKTFGLKKFPAHVKRRWNTQCNNVCTRQCGFSFENK